MWARLHICHRRPKAGPCRTDRTHRASQAGGDRQGFGPPLAPLQTQTLCLRAGSQRSLSPGGVGPRPQPRGFEPPLLRGARQEGVYPGPCWTAVLGQSVPRDGSLGTAAAQGTLTQGCTSEETTGHQTTRLRGGCHASPSRGKAGEGLPGHGPDRGPAARGGPGPGAHLLAWAAGCSAPRWKGKRKSSLLPRLPELTRITLMGLVLSPMPPRHSEHRAGNDGRGSAGRRPGPRDFRFRASAAAAGSPGPRPSGGAELRAQRSRAGRAQRPGRRFSAVPSVRPSAVPAALPTRPQGARRLLLAPGALCSSQHLAVQPCLKCSPAPHTSAPGSQYDPAGHVGASCPQDCAVSHL